MKSRIKLFASIIIALFLLNTTLFYSLQHNVDNLMLSLEKDQSRQAMQRLLNALEREIDAIDRLNFDWAAWDDTYEFILDKNSDYTESNLVDSTFIDSQLDLIVFIDTTGEAVYRQAFDREEEEPLEVPDSFFSALLAAPQIWKFQQPEEFTRGFLRLPKGVLMLSARPILTSDNEGPIRGTIFMGRFFTEQEHARMQELTQQDFSKNLVISEAAVQNAEIQVQLNDEGYLSATVPMPDLLGKPLWQLEASFPRNFFQHGLQSLNTFMRWNLLITGLLALIVGLVTNKLTIARKNIVDSEKRYRELSLELQTILNGIASPIFLVSAEQQVIWVNRTGSEIFGQPETAASGKAELNIPFSSFNDEERCPVKTALASGQKQEAMIQLNDQRIMTLNAFPLADDRQRTRGVICMMTDITEQTRLRDEAEQRNRLTALGELAAGLAHDINNPVGMLLINLPMVKDVYQDFATTLEEDPASASAEFGGLSLDYIKDKLPFLLEEMHANVNKIKKMADDLKGFARQQSATDKTYELNLVINSALRLLDYKIIKATNNFSCNLEKDLPALVGRPHQIEQVLVNLLLNACQALSSNQQAISLSSHYDRQNSQVVVEVKDEGVGINNEQLQQLTRPFYTTKEDQGGTGLGLSMAARIIKEHKGTLDFTSTPETGTCARIALPITKD